MNPTMPRTEEYNRVLHELFEVVVGSPARVIKTLVADKFNSRRQNNEEEF